MALAGALMPLFHFGRSNGPFRPLPEGVETMANRVRKLAEVQESEWTQAVNKIMLGALLAIVAGALLYSVKFWLPLPARMFAQVTLAFAVLAGVGIMAAAVYGGMQVRRIVGIEFPCPYCEKMNRFEAQPNESFDCEYCNRTVHFEDGDQVPVRTVVCPFCSTEHRVAANVQHYVCDRCNRPLELGTVHAGRAVTTAAQPAEQGLLQNYDVLLVSVDRRQENDVALKLQNLMVVNLPEARRLMGGASTATPLIVSHDLPQRKAESIRRQLQDLGATATLRPTGVGARAASRTP